MFQLKNIMIEFLSLKTNIYRAQNVFLIYFEFNIIFLI